LRSPCIVAGCFLEEDGFLSWRNGDEPVRRAGLVAKRVAEMPAVAVAAVAAAAADAVAAGTDDVAAAAVATGRCPMIQRCRRLMKNR
jgi:hypothetical protein